MNASNIQPTRGRRFLKWTGGVAVVIAVLAAFCLGGVEYEPFFLSRHGKATRARFLEKSSSNKLTRGTLQAGFGKALLTPTLNATTDNPEKGEFRSLPLAGYGNRNGKPAEGKNDDLHVKAVALRVGDETAVLIACDALIVPREVSELAMEQMGRDLKLRREQVYLSATHTHCSIGGWGEGPVGEAFAGPFQPGIRIWFARCIVNAVRAAIADLSPAETGTGRFVAEGQVRNRIVGELGRTDPEFSVLHVRQRDGDTATLGSFAAHATVLSGSMMQFSADYPGAWQRAVEEQTRGMALFLAGAVGSHSPVTGEGPGGLAAVERLGKLLAGRTLELLPKIRMSQEIEFGLLGIDVDLPPLQPRILDGVRLRPWFARQLLPARDTTFLQMIRIADSIWFSTPCDFSGELAIDIKNAFRVRGLHAVITSFNGDYVGYVIPPRYYHMNGYEQRVMSFFGPTVPDYFETLMRLGGEKLARTQASPAANQR